MDSILRSVWDPSAILLEFGSAVWTLVMARIILIAQFKSIVIVHNI